MALSVAVAARTLNLKIGRSVLLQPMNLTFFGGEFVGVLGPSGCGKSTLLKCLAGLQRCGGEIELGGKAISAMNLEERRRIGFVPQDDVVHGSLSVERALNYTGRLLGLDAATLATRVDSVIQILELQERRKMRTSRLSGGQRKRVSIAVELMAEPQVLFLDEPTAGLDPALEESFMESCQRLAQGGRTLLMSTHVMQSLDVLDLVLVLQQGYLVFLGRPQEALAYFGVHTLTQIYKPLLQQDPASASQRYSGSPYFANYVTARKASP